MKKRLGARGQIKTALQNRDDEHIKNEDVVFKGIRVKNWQKLSNDMILLNPKQAMKNTLIIYSDSDDYQRPRVNPKKQPEKEINYLQI